MRLDANFRKNTEIPNPTSSSSSLTQFRISQRSLPEKSLVRGVLHRRDVRGRRVPQRLLLRYPGLLRLQDGRQEQHETEGESPRRSNLGRSFNSNLLPQPQTFTNHMPEFYAVRWLHCFKLCAVVAFGVDLWYAHEKALSAERFSRLLRPIYVAVWIPELRRWGNLIARTVPHVWQLIVLLVVLLCTWSIAGVILFGGNQEFNLDGLQNFR